MSSSSPTPARFRQFSLRAAVLALAACGVLFGWDGHRARQQREAVETIRSHEGWVQTEPTSLAWLYELFGADAAYTHQVVSAGIKCHRWDESLPALRRFGHLRKLEVDVYTYEGKCRQTEKGISAALPGVAVEMAYLLD
jgi:hypothetical protein